MYCKNKNNIFIISAASGTGKTSIVSRLINRYANIRVSISHTTRQPRPYEIDGEHYHFTDKNNFEDMIKKQAFLEYAKVYDNYYGTSLESINSLIENGYDVILEIDVQGAHQVRALLPDACSIFILPPSIETLSKRLHGRGADSLEVIKKRLEKAKIEIAAAYEFDYIIINDNLDDAENDLFQIIKSQKLTLSSQKSFVNELLNNT